MKFGFRKPSLRKRIAARTSLKRVVRHNLGLKAPRGWGWLTDPKKAAYNRVYNRTTVGFSGALMLAVGIGVLAAWVAACQCPFRPPTLSSWRLWAIILATDWEFPVGAWPR